MWIDEVELTVESGRGGDGVISFRHEKGVEWGGPNGGRGGKGGDVIIKTTPHMTTLAPLRGRKIFRAEPGEKGEAADRTGHGGDSVTIEVPVGTVIRRSGDRGVIADLSHPDASIIIAHGGRGGRGNAAYATSVNRSPKYRELGEKSEKKRIILEVRLLADAGLVGLPNAGKSTLLSRMSAARPKIADYPFTTLEPLLGIVESPDRNVTFTMADLPGLIRGAHLGKGLGIKFLRHIERTRLLLHLVDATSETAEEDYETIREELEAYGHGLGAKDSILVLTKADALQGELPLAQHRPILISAHSGLGLDQLRHEIARRLAGIAPVPPLRSELMAEEDKPVRVRREEDTFVIEGDAVDRYLDRRSPETIYDWRRFWQTLVRWGVAEELKRLGVRENDTVRIGDRVLEYKDE